MTAPRRFAPAGGRLLKARPAAARGDAVAILTYPCRDLAGDYVRPDGGDWSNYPSNPLVNWHHETPVGRGEVVMKSLKIGGKDWLLPVGTTRFFRSARDLEGVSLDRLDPKTDRPVGRWTPAECLEAAGQAAALVAADAATGVSIEFRPIAATESGRSLLERRPALDVDEWEGLAWAHTAHPVNPHARTVQLDKALSVASSGRIGGRPLCPAIRKSFDALLAARPRRSSASVPAAPPRQEKAMPADPFEDDPEMADPAIAEPEDGDAPDADPAAVMKPTPKALVTIAQGIADLIAQGEDLLSGAEHEAGLARMQEAFDALKDISDGLLADGKGMFPDAGIEAPDAPDGTPAGDDAPPAVAEDGAFVMKAFRKGFPVRFKLSDLRDPKARPAAAPAGGRLTKAQKDRLVAEGWLPPEKGRQIERVLKQTRANLGL